MFEMDFVYIPEGPFVIGEKDTMEVIYLPGYWIGKHPVTVGQWKKFLQDTNYEWDFLNEDHKDSFPITWVNVENAEAFCSWLTSKTDGFAFTLPTELEWEKAARGTDARKYPWGNQEPNEGICNYDYNVGHPTPVGKYSPQGDSPYGCTDMAGNVWEWTRSLHYQKKDSPDVNGEQILRGGSFINTNSVVHCACCNFRPNSLYCFTNSGFRLVVARRPLAACWTGASGMKCQVKQRNERMLK